MAEFNPYAAAATHLGEKAKENPALSDADAKLLQSIDGHGSKKNFQSLGEAIEASGNDQIEGVASAQVAHQEDGRGARLRGEERAQVMGRLRVLEASRGVRKSGIPIASRGLPPPEGTSFVNVCLEQQITGATTTAPWSSHPRARPRPAPRRGPSPCPARLQFSQRPRRGSAGGPPAARRRGSAERPSCGAATTTTTVSPAPAHRSITEASARRAPPNAACDARATS